MLIQISYYLRPLACEYRRDGCIRRQEALDRRVWFSPINRSVKTSCNYTGVHTLRSPEWPSATSFLWGPGGGKLGILGGEALYPSNSVNKTLDLLLGLKGIRLLGTLRRSYRQSGNFLFQFFLLRFFGHLFLLLWSAWHGLSFSSLTTFSVL